MREFCVLRILCGFLEPALDDEVGEIQEGGPVVGRGEPIQGLPGPLDVGTGNLKGAVNGGGSRNGLDRFPNPVVGGALGEDAPQGPNGRRSLPGRAGREG